MKIATVKNVAKKWTNPFGNRNVRTETENRIIDRYSLLDDQSCCWLARPRWDLLLPPLKLEFYRISFWFRFEGERGLLSIWKKARSIFECFIYRVHLGALYFNSWTFQSVHSLSKIVRGIRYFSSKLNPASPFWLAVQ